MELGDATRPIGVLEPERKSAFDGYLSKRQSLPPKLRSEDAFSQLPQKRQLRVIADAIRQLKATASLLLIGRIPRAWKRRRLPRLWRPSARPACRNQSDKSRAGRRCWTHDKTLAVVLGSLVAARRHGRLLAVVPPVANGARLQ